MKRIIITLLLASCLIFAGCNQKAENIETVPPKSEQPDNKNTTSDSVENTDESTLDETEVPTNADSISAEVQPIQAIITENSKTFYYDGYHTLYEYKYGTIRLDDEDADKYPKLNESLKNISDELANDTISAAENGLDDIKEWYNTQKEYGEVYGYCEDSNTLKVLRADSNVFSVRNDFYSYLGGAHGNYGYSSHSYDSKSGVELTLDDIFTSKEELANVIYDSLGNNYDKEGFYDYDNMKESIVNEINEGTLIFDMDNLFVNIFFNPYDLGPYASGMFEVHLPYSEYAGTLINENIATIPGNVIFGFSSDSELHVALGDDDKESSINVSYIMPSETDYDWIDGINVSVDGKSAEAEVYAYSTDNYLVKYLNKTYIYIFCHGENDYTYPVVFDITNGDPRWIEIPEENYTGVYPASCYLGGDYDEEDFSTYSVDIFCFTNPEKMYMSSHTDVMSTVSGTALYKVSTSGYPEKIDANAWLNILSDNYIFTAREDVTGTQVNEDGSEVGAFTIKAGTKCNYYRTDGINKADVKLEDGTIVRLELDHESWPIMVDGKELENAFDGIIFAG